MKKTRRASRKNFRHPPKRRERTSQAVSPAKLRKALSEQRSRRKLVLQEKAARAARAGYKPRKKDRGKVLMIGVKGQRDPQAKGRKGYLVYVTKTGKVWLQKVKGIKEPFKPRKLREIEIPLKKNLHKKIEVFLQSRLVTVKRGKMTDAELVKKAVKASGKMGLRGDAAARMQDFQLSGRGRGAGKVKAGGAHDFNGKIVKKIAKHLQSVLRKQASQRVFTIQAIGLIQLPTGEREVIEFSVPIERGDRDGIDLGGIENFVKLKFYSFMAKQLSFMGYVSAGSANHIRSLSDNEGVDEGEWVDKNGQSWAGNDLEIARIISLEWRIEQSK